MANQRRSRLRDDRRSSARICPRRSIGGQLADGTFRIRVVFRKLLSNTLGAEVTRRLQSGSLSRTLPCITSIASALDKDFLEGKTAVFDDQSPSTLIAPIRVQIDESIYFCVDRIPQHASGCCTDDSVEKTLPIELSPERIHFRAKHFAYRRVLSVCFSLGHAVFLCPLRAERGVKPQPNTPPFSVP